MGVRRGDKIKQLKQGVSMSKTIRKYEMGALRMSHQEKIKLVDKKHQFVLAVDGLINSKTSCMFDKYYKKHSHKKERAEWKQLIALEA